jgi:hypothetical protein
LSKKAVRPQPGFSKFFHMHGVHGMLFPVTGIFATAGRENDGK